MSAHDNHGTNYYHLHISIKETEVIEAIRKEFKKYGNIEKHKDGPIRGFGAFIYTVNRAARHGRFDSDLFAYDEKWHRRPRPRGRGGRGRKDRVPAT